jgi:hypothetical protein
VSYRDDHDAAIARIDSLERDNRQLVAETERLANELEAARQWLGGTRKRMLVAIAFGALGLALVVTWIWIAFRSGERVLEVNVPAPDYPPTTGVIVADGPKVGHWVATITSCTVHGDRVELGTLANDEHRIWLDQNGVELELPTGMVTLDERRCRTHESAVMARGGDPPTFDGYARLDCRFGMSPERAVPDLVAGKLDFVRCRSQ